MITARQARLRFSNKDYVDAMVAVNQAILLSSSERHEVTVTIETGKYSLSDNIPLQVKYALQKVGFEVFLDHDASNGTTEINVRW